MFETWVTFMVVWGAVLVWLTFELCWDDVIKRTSGNVAAAFFGWAVWLFMLGWGLLS